MPNSMAMRALVSRLKGPRASDRVPAPSVVCGRISTAIAALAIAATAFPSLSCSPTPTAPTTHSADYSPSWSPQGDSIAFVHIAADQKDRSLTGIYIIAASGGASRLVRPVPARSVDWAPDGHWLVYDTPEGLFRCNAQQDTSAAIFYGAAFFPSCSPRGDTVAFDDLTDVWLTPVVGGTPRRLSSSLQRSRDPDWSPDGAALVMRHFPAGASASELITVTVDGDLIRRLTNDSNEDRYPAWSPSGNLVCWNRFVQSNSRITPELWLVDTSGTGPRLLVRSIGEMSWSPVGDRLAISSETTLGAKLFLADPSTGSTIQLTR